MYFCSLALFRVNPSPNLAGLFAEINVGLSAFPPSLRVLISLRRDALSANQCAPPVLPCRAKTHEDEFRIRFCIWNKAPLLGASHEPIRRCCADTLNGQTLSLGTKFHSSKTFRESAYHHTAVADPSFNLQHDLELKLEPENQSNTPAGHAALKLA